MEEARKAKILNKRKRKAENENNKLLIVSTSADLAELHMKQGRYEDAIWEYETIANIYKSNNKLEYAKAHRGIGEAYMGLQKFEEALKHQKIYLNIALEEKNDIEQQRAYATIGHMYLSHYLETQNDPEKNLNIAYTNFMKSLMIAENLTGIPKLEKADMLARLLSNLGLVKESLGDYTKASELLKRSVAMCKQHDIYEQLIRGYMSIASLHDKHGQSNDINDAIHHYNLAIDAAKNLKGNVDLICAALLAKSDLLIKVSDFHSAKQALLKAYKLRTPNIQEKDVIEKNLRIVASMCQLEDKLFVSCNNDKELEKLYEQMGDYACSLKHFSKAIEYYKLTLKHAEKSGTNGKTLASYYYSLGECYKDMSQYKEAEKYYEKEYNLCDNLKDNLNTLSKIADTKETANAPVTEVKAVYERALKNCQNSGNLKEERRMVERCIKYLQRSNNPSDASQMVKYLESLDVPDDEESSSSSENESEEVETGYEIDLEDITDNSEDSDIEQQSKIESSSVIGRRRNKNIVKKNAKGESKLHLACISGQVPVVQHLLQQGHPVNVRDNSGWLPLHEACNHGHLEIVRMLLDKGATINDRGGTQCDGITPLYDAANNGHLRIVELLLDRGASAVVKTDTGDSALNVLRTWHRKDPFVGEDLELYEKLTKRMSEVLEKLGHKVDEEDADCGDNRERDKEKRTRLVIGGKENRSRSYQELVEAPYTEDTNLTDFFEDDGDQFLRKVTPPRKKSTTEPKPSQSSSKRSTLIPENDLFDDWLEDDIGLMNAAKKRKTNCFEGSESTIGRGSKVRTSMSPRISQKSPLKRVSSETHIPEIIPIMDKSDSDSIQSLPFQERNASLTQFSNKTRKSSTSPFPRKLPLSKNNSFEGNSSRQPKITNFVSSRSYVEADSTTPSSSQEAPRSQVAPQIPLSVDLMVFVDVKVEGMVFRVPVRVSQLQTHSIGWLAEEAALKYARKECSRPCLELETTSGALLSNEDPLTLLFPLGTMTAEPVVGKIVKLCLPPLIERYKEACSQMNSTANTIVSSTVEEMSVRLSLENSGLLSTTLTPLCTALNHQTSLLEINLSGNFVDTSCLAKLCFSLPSLVNLSILNLSSTGLQAVHLAEFVKIFTSASKPILEKLTCLDLSDNPLRNKSLQHLSEITKYLRLRSLNLSNCRFDRNLFQEDRHCLTLENVERLDVSDNRLHTGDIKKLVSWSSPGVLTELDVGRNDGGNRNVLGSLLELWREQTDSVAPKSLSLSRCNVDENELYDLLSSRKSLERLNLSYNPNLTGISLRRLLEYPNLQEINLLGCQNIFQYFDQIQDFQATAHRVLKISADANSRCDKIVKLTEAFRKLFSNVSAETGDVLIVRGSK